MESRSPRLPIRILEVYVEALTGFSHIASRWSQQHLPLSRFCPWSSPHCRDGRQNCTFQGQGGGKQPPIAHVQLKGQLAVISSWCLSLGTRMMGDSSALYFYAFSIFCSNWIITFKIGHMLIKRTLFLLICKGCKILQSLSLTSTQDEVVPKPLSRKT